MKPLFLILLIVMNLFWAGTYATFKVLGQHLGAGAIATVRYALAAAILTACWPWLRGRGPRGKDLGLAAVMGAVVFCIAPRLQIEGVHRGQAGDTSLLMALEPLITAVAAAVFLREHIAARRWWGCALGILGVAMMSQAWRPEAQPLASLTANLLFIASFLGETAYSIMGKPLLERTGIFKLLTVALLAGTAANLLLEALLGHGSQWRLLLDLPLNAWLLFLYLAVICTVTGYALWYVVIRETEVNVTALTVFIQPIAGLTISVLALGEAVHAGQLWGSLAIVAGLMIGLRRNGRTSLERSMARAQN